MAFSHEALGLQVCVVFALRCAVHHLSVHPRMENPSLPLVDLQLPHS